MAHFGGFNFTTFNGVNLKNTAAIRFVAEGANVGTMSVQTAIENPRAWYLTDKTGKLPIAGTFDVQLPAVAASTFVYNTVVTVTGIRVEDGITATYMDELVSTAIILAGAKPGNGNITLSFINLGVATAYSNHTIAYTAIR